MKKIFNFLNKYSISIILLLLLVISFRNCSIKKEIRNNSKKQESYNELLTKKIDSLSIKMITNEDLIIEGLKSEKRMIQSCDRKKFDLEREKEIDEELKRLTN